MAVLRIGERALLIEDRGRDELLPDVVQEAARSNALLLTKRTTNILGQITGKLSNRVRVLVQILRLGREQVMQSFMPKSDGW
jgi:hypothetical protein